jgi:hypothetical protein
MTILQFQELYFIAQGKDFDFDKSVKMAGVMSGKTPDEVDKMPMKRFNSLCAKIQKQFEVFNKDLKTGKPIRYAVVKGRFYQFNYTHKDINAGKYVEALTFGQDTVTNLHKIMATIATPMKLSGIKLVPTKRLHEDIAKDMESLNFMAAYQAAVFFYTLYNVSMQIIQPYLVSEAVTKGMRREEVEATLTNLTQIMDGFTMPNWSQNLKGYALNRFGV